MKKRALAIAFLLASLVVSVQAEEKNGWYIGTKMGWSHFDPFKYNFNQFENNNTNFSIENFSAPILGVFLGYELNPYFGLEIENNTNGFFPHLMFKKNKIQLQSNSVQLSTKLSYPVTDDLHIYTKLGGMMLWNNIFSTNDLQNMFNKNSSILPSVALGVEYIFHENFITRLDYTWKNSIQNILNSSIQPSLGDAALSFGWKFGNSDDNDVFSSYDSEFSNKPYTVLNENVTFPFNSTELKPSAYDKLNKLDDDIKNMDLKNVSIILSGHSDRIGNKEYNQQLSEDRAYSIKNYLTSRGFSRENITVQGMGNRYSLTNQVCKGIKNKSLLISCLAPDRRVEIEVLSNMP